MFLLQPHFPLIVTATNGFWQLVSGTLVELGSLGGIWAKAAWFCFPLVSRQLTTIPSGRGLDQQRSTRERMSRIDVRLRFTFYHYTHAFDDDIDWCWAIDFPNRLLPFIPSSADSPSSSSAVPHTVPGLSYLDAAYFFPDAFCPPK